jgi:4-hydroxy-tetrahydrodipicolinate synthase
MPYILATALVAPYTKEGTDFDAYKKLITLQQKGGFTHLLVNGTTGEPNLLSEEEKTSLLSFAVQNKGRLFVMAGCGATDTNKTLESCKKAEGLGADCLLLVTPYYNKTNQKGALKHFEYIADRVSLPLYLYNVPARTGFDLSAESVIELSKHGKIAGIKQANGNVADTARLIPYLSEDFCLLCGDDALTLPFSAMGAKGVVSVASNAYPRLVAEAFYGDIKAYSDLVELSGLLFKTTNPMPIKYLLYKMGILSQYCLRLPLVEIEEDLKAAIDKKADELTDYL